MSEYWSFVVVTFVSIFTMIDPLGNIPVFIALTEGLGPREVRRVAWRATLTATLILLLFQFAGQAIFSLFHISSNSLQIVGGVIFFVTGYEMLQARLTRSLHDNGPSDVTYANDIAITPLGIPMICGPGAITTVIIRMTDADSTMKQGLLTLVIVLTLAITFIMLIGAKSILKFLGESGNKVLLRLMGLIVMAIAVELFFSGLSPYVKAMLAKG
ncbi:MAG TPA: MarC family protein [Gemmatales bacterium]|nr:MarC family protein [Gemmatales bacterium]